MPVEFPGDEEASAYGVYRGALSQSDLEKLFFLDDADRQLIAKRRGSHNRLGFAAAERCASRNGPLARALMFTTFLPTYRHSIKT